MTPKILLGILDAYPYPDGVSPEIVWRPKSGYVAVWLRDDRTKAEVCEPFGPTSAWTIGHVEKRLKQLVERLAEGCRVSVDYAPGIALAGSWDALLDVLERGPGWKPSTKGMGGDQ